LNKNLKGSEDVVEDQFPISWDKTLLAIIPGLLATLGFVTSDFSARMLVGLFLLVLFLIVVFWSNNRQLPGWGLMALGMLVSIGLVITSGVLGGLAAIFAGKSATAIILLVILAILITILRFSFRSQRVPYRFGPSLP
jgi:hypothetical protein